MADARHRTLLVDDDEPLRTLTRMLLARAGRFEVVGEATDGEEAVALAADLQPDLILLDLAMPRMDGFEALPLLRRAVPRAKVVAYSMLPPHRNEALARERGAVAYIDKGVSSPELVRRLVAELVGRVAVLLGGVFVLPLAWALWAERRRRELGPGGADARAEARGLALTLLSPDEWLLMADIEKLIGQTFPREVIAGFEPSVAPLQPKVAAADAKARSGLSVRGRAGGRRRR